MKLALLTIAVLLGSSTAIAAERYTEVWNPPEVQSTKSKNKARVPTQNTAQSTAKKKRKGATAVKQVADKGTVESSGAAAVPSRPSASSSSRKPAEPVIPRKIEPNGQVMRV
ncbi:hypothetical protein [Caballeronia sp. TF1N1]|uniref:hypothetical protein n=1 Tax=Caballeronia sp. TF1N1 TaxID=2878153 RepID=UPI001FD45E13|nr:hypothetical protein [Caballeronia sp. TF1N1]